MEMQLKKDILTILQGDKEEIADISKKFYDQKYLDDFIATTNSHKLTQSIFNLLVNSGFGKNNKIICQKYEYFKEINDNAIHRQFQTIKCIEDILEKERTVWIKGIPLSTILYDDPFSRRSGDMDFLVESTKQKEFVKLLENRGFKKIGILNEDIGLRYSVHFHEIQLMSPYGILVEVKQISGEMAIFKSEDLVSDFFSNTVSIDICGEKFETLDLNYTLIHLFLSAFSNSTAWYDMKSNGIRDLYEIMLFTKKYTMDYTRIHYLTNKYGISSVIREIMKKINLIFGQVFPDSVISIFKQDDTSQHLIDKLYISFLKYYDIGYIDELFNIQKRTEAYMNAVSKAYFLENINCNDNYLSPDILEYNLCSHNDNLKLDLYLESKYLYSEREHVFVIKFICNEPTVTNKYGSIFVFYIVLKEGTTEAYLINDLDIESVQPYKVCIEAHSIVNVGSRTHFVYYMEPPFFNENNKRICYNVQLNTHNENDTSNLFDLTIMCPQKNTLPIFHMEYL